MLLLATDVKLLKYTLREGRVTVNSYCAPRSPWEVYADLSRRKTQRKAQGLPAWC